MLPASGAAAASGGFCVENLSTDDLLTLIAGHAVTQSADAEYLKPVAEQLTRDDWRKLWEMSCTHQIQALVYYELSRCGCNQLVPADIRDLFEEISHASAIRFFSFCSFTSFVVSIFRSNGIPCIVLKGITLSSLYPAGEVRNLTDADIYVPDKEDFNRAKKLLIDRGFVRMHNQVDHHLEYSYTMNQGVFILELHSFPAASLPDGSCQREVEKIFSDAASDPDNYHPLGMDVPALRPELYAMSLCLHMLQHFMSAGFGLRLLCDWVVFLKSKGAKMDCEKFCRYICSAGMGKFVWSVTAICSQKLGLDIGADAPFMSMLRCGVSGEQLEKMYLDIISGGDFGAAQKPRMVAVPDDLGLISYLKTLNRQTSFKYPRASKIFVLLPFLWVGTVFGFLHNNRHLRKVKTIDILKSAEERGKLLKELELFRKKGKR